MTSAKLAPCACGALSAGLRMDIHQRTTDATLNCRACGRTVRAVGDTAGLVLSDLFHAWNSQASNAA